MNVHHYDELDADPRAHRERLAGIWRQIAEKYQAYPDVLQFEIYNEPHGKLSASEWNSTWVLALAEIRKTNPQRAVHIGGVQWNQSSTLKDLQLPESDRHIIGHFHSYAPFQFTHQGAEWVGGSTPWVGTKWVATPAEQAEVLKVFSQASEWSRQTQRPVFLGEYGSYGKYADAESRIRWTAFMATTARKNGIPAAYWEYCSGFGLWNPLEKQWREPLLNAVLSR
jgi:endoglucanase